MFRIKVKHYKEVASPAIKDLRSEASRREERAAPSLYNNLIGVGTFRTQLRRIGITSEIRRDTASHAVVQIYELK